MTDSANSTAQQDESAVAAVRSGDAERYRELVERHERRVFAVAWSRLGDAALAEEATQEAFIRAYRRLWLLGDGAKFSGWVSAIARRVAINFGLRHRRELNKRKLWALENAPVSTAENSANEPDPLLSPETLRQTLAELAPAHRECLVLFYLEGKSGAEAAVALGISEAALRVRLHRARAAMRERLEEKIESSLANLRPAETLVPAVMAGVLASSSAKAGGTIATGVGAKIVSVLGKSFLFAWLVPLLSVIVNLPALIAVSFIMRKERENYRDADGFRPRLHRQFYKSFIWGFPLVIVLMGMMNQSTLAAWGIKGSQLFVGCLLLFVTLIAARCAFFFRNPQMASSFVYGSILTAGTIAFDLGWFPASLASLPMLLATVWFFFTFKRPVRMDYSLFLRAAHGQLKISDEMDVAPTTNHLDRHALKSFARFLASRLLVTNFRWETNGLALRLPPVTSRFLTNMAGVFMPPVGRNCSHISLGLDGTVLARCGKTDLNDLSALKIGRLGAPGELEKVVEESVVQAWQEFRSGNLSASERTLGDSPESDVFIVPPSSAKSMRWWRIFVGAAVLLMITGTTLQFLPQFLPSVWRTRLDGMKPVSITEAQVRAFLNDTTPNPDPTKFKFNSPALALFTCLVLPSTNLFSPEGLQAMRDEVGDGRFEAVKHSDAGPLAIFNAPLPRIAIASGWVNWDDLGIRPEDAAVNLRTNRFQMYSSNNWDHFLTREQAWSWVKSVRFAVMRIQSDGLAQLRLLQALHCLDLTDRDKLIRQIASVQVLSATPPGQPPLHDWKDVRGLFFTPCSPALQDTYYSLAALEVLGGLDKIDREACIDGILSRHQGKGYFTSPDSGGYNEYHIDGSARDIIAAFESLRILGALDRVKDLDEWQFRVASHRLAKPDANGVRTLTWDEVEAWVCQQRLAEILRKRKENPPAPFGSLLQSGEY